MKNTINDVYIKEPVEAIVNELTTQKKDYVIIGGPGAGKTTILQKLVEKSKNHFMLSSKDFVFIDKELNENEMAHFMELLIFIKVYDQVYINDRPKKVSLAQRRIDNEKELYEFYSHLIGSGPEPKKYLNFMENTKDIIELAELEKRHICFVFDDFHRIPKSIREMVKNYSNHFSSRIIGFENNESLLNDFQTSTVIEPLYSKNIQFSREYMAQVVYNFNLSKSNLKDYLDGIEYRDKLKLDLVSLIGEAHFESLLKRADGDLNQFSRSITDIMSVVHEHGLEKTKKIVDQECCSKQKRLI